VVAKIIPFPGGAAATMTYNNAIPGIVKTRADAAKNAIIFELYTDFPSSGLSSDRVHPNVAGYAWMGAEVYEAIGSLFPR
jgi:lysophospholipase L1-like esterase